MSLPSIMLCVGLTESRCVRVLQRDRCGVTPIIAPAVADEVMDQDEMEDLLDDLGIDADY